MVLSADEAVRVETAKECIRAAGDLVDTINIWHMHPVMTCVLTFIQFSPADTTNAADPHGPAHMVSSWQRRNNGLTPFTEVQKLSADRLTIWLTEWESTLKWMLEVSREDFWLS